MLIQLAGKKKRDLDRSRGVKMGANSFEVTFFSFWLNLMNFCFSKFSVTTNAEKTDNPNIDIIDVDKPSIGTINPVETNKVEKLGIGTLVPAKINRAEKLSTRIVNLIKLTKRKNQKQTHQTQQKYTKQTN